MNHFQNQSEKPYGIDDDPTSSPWYVIKKFPVRDKSKLLVAILKILLNPERTDAIFTSLDLFIKNEKKFGGGISKFIDRFMEDPSIKPLVEERYLPDPPDLDELLKLPEDTLGYVFASHMRRNNLSVVFYSPVNVTNDYRWLELRGRQTHDIMHVVTGFGTSVPDELGLQAATLGQLSTPVSAAIIGGGLLNGAFFKPWLLTEMMEKISFGYQLGKSCNMLIGYKYEDNWEKPLSVVRQELRIEKPATSLIAV